RSPPVPGGGRTRRAAPGARASRGGEETGERGACPHETPRRRVCQCRRPRGGVRRQEERGKEPPGGGGRRSPGGSFAGAAGGRQREAPLPRDRGGTFRSRVFTEPVGSAAGALRLRRSRPVGGGRPRGGARLGRRRAPQSPPPVGGRAAEGRLAGAGRPGRFLFRRGG